jgi:hypothetical protein
MAGGRASDVERSPVASGVFPLDKRSSHAILVDEAMNLAG